MMDVDMGLLMEMVINKGMAWGCQNGGAVIIMIIG
jgi:hypothetical protein